MNPATFRLAPHLVPRPLWGLSCAQLLPWKEWNLIRQDALKLAKNACGICGATGRICHEVWTYDDHDKTATLTRFEIHCVDCDAATHMGRAMVHGSIRIAAKQLCIVNGMKPAEVRSVFATHMSTFKERSRHEWSIVVPDELAQKYPQLQQFRDAVADKLAAR